MSLTIKSFFISLAVLFSALQLSTPKIGLSQEIPYKPLYSKKQVAELKAQVKMVDLLIRFAKEHPDDVKFLEDPAYFEREIKRQIPEFAEIARQVTLTDLAVHEADRLKTNIIEAAKYINWDKFRIMWMDMSKSFKGFIRVKGVGFASFFIMVYAVDIVLHAALLSTKFAYLAAISGVIPYAAFVTDTLYGKYKDIRLRRQMTKLLGGREAYKNFMAVRNQVLTDLKLKYSSDIMLDLPFGTHKGNFVIAFSPPKDWKDKLKRKIGLDSDKCTYQKIRSFCLEHSIEEGFLNEIDLRKDIPQELKAVFLMKRIALEKNIELENAFIEKFSAHLSELEVLPNYDVHSVWIKKLIRIHSVDEALKVLETVPEGTSPAIVSRAWKNIGIPALARNDSEIPLFKFNNLVHSFMSLEASSELASKESWSVTWLNQYKVHLLAAMNKKCKDYAVAD